MLVRTLELQEDGKYRFSGPPPLRAAGHGQYVHEGWWWCECGVRFGPGRDSSRRPRRDHMAELWATGDWFWQRVDTSGGCWIWLGPRDGSGYGRLKLSASPVSAHLVAYQMTNGPVPDGKELDHLCRIRLCVRPDHLEPVTHRENMLRGSGVASANAAKTHCPRGHEYVHLTDRRDCQVCHTEMGRARRVRSARA